MKLTIIRLQHFSAQDCLDLAKIWPDVVPAMLEETLDRQHQLYAAKFNDRLLAAVRIILQGETGELHHFMVREVTRRRGVGKYLLEEVLAQNETISRWWIADTGLHDANVTAAFAKAAGFRALPGGWEWQRN
ncbi:aspartate 1-decarboxylase autocleavage activator PanM [Erwinia psidii]|uniref:PanD regulatory factor n=1 Tax=Erwinia psidii TaxID=69224 RepID=A0A3N6S952_9GAMM|nr:aspartate 1-decarboxylase autocleavage activator PanM [Erwinia psidii]MCX8959491.1 aspartate 1-decarboxylase autocleavage activator PanM [Erwinia psidii]MCX8961883.1 aspartate 1-decarboxylase autocleavage activator PanM [Erwinia psidii]MCX8966539.1 aspartate 1-decarboxylase autocleavage activator PanM [Erwinia psidii]RQM37740.1 aspartate 1-decarboxylase autocleavage activator PanM [Erwinia psidii]